MFFIRSIFVSSISPSELPRWNVSRASFDTDHVSFSIPLCASPRGLRVIIFIIVLLVVIATTIFIEIRPNEPSRISLWPKASINSTNLCRPFPPTFTIFQLIFVQRNPSDEYVELRARVRRHCTNRELGSWNGSTEKRGNWKYWANWPRKNTASIFYESSQLFRHNERVYGRNYAKLYAATRSPVQLGNGDNAGGGEGKRVCTRFSPSIREVGAVETVFIDRQTQKMARRKEMGSVFPVFLGWINNRAVEPMKVKRPAR